MTAVCAGELVATMLADCALVRTLCDAEDAAEVLGRTVLDAGGPYAIAEGSVQAYDGSTLAIAAPLILIEDEGTQSEALGQPSGYRYFGELTVDLILTQPTAATLSAASTTLMRWARAQQATIVDQCEALIGSEGYLSRASVSAPRPMIHHDLRPLAGTIIIPFDISWS